MELEQAGRKGKTAWKMFFAGVLSGVMVSFLLLVVLAFRYGPCGESIEVDLYSGHILIYMSSLWKRSRTPGPEWPHVRWAREHQNPVRSWYMVAGSISRGWFEKGLAVDYTTREHVLAIYRLEMPEEEKVKLLHQYHEDLDALKLEEQEFYESRKFMERFHETWDQRVKDAAKGRQSSG